MSLGKRAVVQAAGRRLAMKNRWWKWAILAVAGAVSGTAMLLLLHSIPIATGTATIVIATVIVLKHLALTITVGSPLAALFRSIRPKLRSHCPFAQS
jgi:hypothetical protein